MGLLYILADIAREARNLFISFNVLEACFLDSRNTSVVFVFSGCDLLLLGRSDDNRWQRACLEWRLSNWFRTCLCLTLSTVSKKAEGTAQ